MSNVESETSSVCETLTEAQHYIMSIWVTAEVLEYSPLVGSLL